MVLGMKWVAYKLEKCIRLNQAAIWQIMKTYCCLTKRRDWDLNPGGAFGTYTLSRRAP
jgi:hypothetical protein